MFLLCTGTGYSSSRLAWVRYFGFRILCSGTSSVFKNNEWMKTVQGCQTSMRHSKGLEIGTIWCHTPEYEQCVPLILVFFISYHADYFISQQMYIGFCLTKRLLPNIIYFALSPLSFMSFKAFLQRFISVCSSLMCSLFVLLLHSRLPYPCFLSLMLHLHFKQESALMLWI